MVQLRKFSEEWIPVARFRGFNAVMEADMLCSRMTAEGLNARVFDGATIQWMPHLANTLSGVRVCVPREEAEQAEALMAEFEEFGGDFEDIDANESGAAFTMTGADAVRCPACGSEEVESQRASLLFGLFSVLLFGIPLLLRWSSWRCGDCGWTGRSGDIY